jgi:hypothetical protein
VAGTWGCRRLARPFPLVDEEVETQQVCERPITQRLGLPVPTDLHEGLSRAFIVRTADSYGIVRAIGIYSARLTS